MEKPYNYRQKKGEIFLFINQIAFVTKLSQNYHNITQSDFLSLVVKL